MSKQSDVDGKTDIEALADTTGASGMRPEVCRGYTKSINRLARGRDRYAWNCALKHGGQPSLPKLKFLEGKDP